METIKKIFSFIGKSIIFLYRSFITLLYLTLVLGIFAVTMYSLLHVVSGLLGFFLHKYNFMNTNGWYFVCSFWAFIYGWACGSHSKRICKSHETDFIEAVRSIWDGSGMPTMKHLIIVSLVYCVYLFFLIANLEFLALVTVLCLFSKSFDLGDSSYGSSTSYTSSSSLERSSPRSSYQESSSDYVYVEPTKEYMIIYARQITSNTVDIGYGYSIDGKKPTSWNNRMINGTLQNWNSHSVTILEPMGLMREYDEQMHPVRSWRVPKI